MNRINILIAMMVCCPIVSQAAPLDVGSDPVAVELTPDQQVLVEKENARLLQKQESPLTVTEQADLLSKGWRERRVGEFAPPVTSTQRPADYINELHRGTLEYDSAWKNYSFHLVRIPDGTEIAEANFSQVAPKTEAIVREPGFGHDLVFTDCNMVNVLTHDDWKINGSNTAQVDRVGAIKPDGSVQVTDSVFVSSDPKTVNDQRKKPEPSVVDGLSVCVLQ